jgi:hypothetical protein
MILDPVLNDGEIWCPDVGNAASGGVFLEVAGAGFEPATFGL